MAVLSKDELKKFLYKGDKPLKERLVITPILDPDQIGDGSVDLRLGTDFIVVRRVQLTALDPAKRTEIEENIERCQTSIHIPYGTPFYLHPQQFALASTFEYLSIPENFMAYVIGRSSWGRLGLVIATATMVHPKYQGVLTLELANIGSVPIALYPCVRIAQLVIHKVGLDKETKEE